MTPSPPAGGRFPSPRSEPTSSLGAGHFVRPDVTKPEDAETAVQAAIDRFRHIDVRVNNAANFCGGYFEKLTPAQIQDQLATGMLGPMNVTRAVLPVMRKQRFDQTQRGGQDQPQPAVVTWPRRWRG